MVPHLCAQSFQHIVLADILYIHQLLYSISFVPLQNQCCYTMLWICHKNSLFQLLFNLFCDIHVLAVQKQIYVLDKCHHSIIVIIMTSTLQILSCFLPCRFMTQNWHLLNFHISIPVFSATTTLSFMDVSDVSSSGRYLGGGCLWIA